MNKDKTMPELKPCPFCSNGGVPDLWAGDWAETDYGVTCKQCEVTVDPSGLVPVDKLRAEGKSDEEIAIIAWNTRADLANRDAEMLAEVLISMVSKYVEFTDDELEKYARFNAELPLIIKARQALATYQANKEKNNGR